MKEFKTELELFKFYDRFSGQNLSQLFASLENEYPNVCAKIKTQKGVVGHLLEGITGRPPNSDSQADISNLGIELKVLPLTNTTKKIQPKERCKLKSISYRDIVNENWETSNLKNKISKILFLTYIQPKGKTFKDWKEFEFTGPIRYELKKNSPEIVELDWFHIKSKVQKKLADELSESDGKILGASTSGNGKLVKYSNGCEAKQRSYSLKHSHMKHFFEQEKNPNQFESIHNKLSSEKPIDESLKDLLNEKINNKTLKQLSEEYKVKFSSSSKSGFRLLINKILNIDSKKIPKEINELGIQIKTIPVSSEYNPWESMSFPKISLFDILNEKWEFPDDNDIEEFESTFKNQIDLPFIFVPIIKNKINNKFEPWTNWKVGRIINWRPNKDQLSEIQIEWEKAKDIIHNKVQTHKVKWGNGYRQNNNLLKEKKHATNYIHMRPHAKNSQDIDVPYKEYTRNSVSICWQSFWFNKKFIQSLIKSS